MANEAQSAAGPTVTPAASGLSTTSLVSLAIGVLGLATAVISNATQLHEIVEDVTFKDASGITGEWTALFREYRVETKHEEIAGSRLTLHMKRGGVITGVETTSEGRPRDWKIEGNFLDGTNPETHTEGRFISLNYVSTRPERSQSIGSIVLHYDSAKGIYFGSVTFYDMDLGQIATYPYLLTKDIDATAKVKYKALLEQAPKIVEIPTSSS
jgi:hypothetical protein